MSSENERREVAERLRHYTDNEMLLDRAVLHAICDCCEPTNDPIGYVLADFIDPTSTVVWKHTGSYPYEACSVCGGAFEHAPSYYTYCPNCGARLVSADDQ